MSGTKTTIAITPRDMMSTHMLTGPSRCFIIPSWATKNIMPMMMLAMPAKAREGGATAPVVRFPTVAAPCNNPPNRRQSLVAFG